MSGSQEPGSGRGNVYFWQQCPVPPCQGVRDPGSRDRPAHYALAHKGGNRRECSPCTLELVDPHSSTVPGFLLVELGVGTPSNALFLPVSSSQIRGHLVQHEPSCSGKVGPCRAASFPGFRTTWLFAEIFRGRLRPLGEAGRLGALRKMRSEVQESQMKTWGLQRQEKQHRATCHPNQESEPTCPAPSPHPQETCPQGSPVHRGPASPDCPFPLPLSGECLVV